MGVLAPGSKAAGWCGPFAGGCAGAPRLACGPRHHVRVIGAHDALRADLRRLLLQHREQRLLLLCTCDTMSERSTSAHSTLGMLMHNKSRRLRSDAA